MLGVLGTMLAFVAIIAAVMLVLMIRALSHKQAMIEIARELGANWRSTGPLAAGEIYGDVDGHPMTIQTLSVSAGFRARQTLLVELVVSPPIPFQGEIGLLDSVVRARRRAAAAATQADIPVLRGVLEQLRLLSAADYGEDPDAHLIELDVDDRFEARVRDQAAFEEAFDDDAVLALRRLAETADDILVLPSRIRWYAFDSGIDADTLLGATRSAAVLADIFRRRRMRRAGLHRARSRPPAEELV